ncbi:MAG: ankyrin repeat domain-containing protein [Rickettsiaceae bacterium]|nr:ankyrin repeat domain-containing protein [Rickettsiaceae bacterium]
MRKVLLIVENHWRQDIELPEEPTIIDVQNAIEEATCLIYRAGHYYIHGHRPAHFLVEPVWDGLLDSLRDDDAQITIILNEARPLLHAYRSIKGTNSWLSSGADLEVRDEKGRTPLHRAAVFIHPEFHSDRLSIIHTLLSAGADLGTIDDEGNTPLHTVCASGCSPQMTALLIKLGADVTAINSTGHTPIALTYSSLIWGWSKSAHRIDRAHAEASIACIEKTLPETKGLAADITPTP